LSYLIDTNVLSELRRKKPDPHVARWLGARAAHQLYLSVLTVGEIRKGVERLGADAEQKAGLLDWLENELPHYFQHRLLSIDFKIAKIWGKLTAQTKRPLPAIDSLLAATAITHQLILVTRNTKDFEDLPVDLLNPWQDS
jgi:toxin FitB